jgi:HPt (histidine-containing phosphotransfer) domain-containing protein
LQHLGTLINIFYSDVLSALNTARPLFKSYLRIRSSASSANSPELREARSELEQTLQDLSQDLEDLVESVKAVEHDPYRFGLEIDEVERRRTLVKEVGNEIENMREELQQTVEHAKNKGKTAANGDMLPDPDSFEDDDNYAAFEQERQMEMMHEQDEALDGVFRTVGNLRQQADDMGRELEEQGEMLNDVDNVADRVGGKLQIGLKRVGDVIKKNEGASSHPTCVYTAILIDFFSRFLVKLLHRSPDLRSDPPSCPTPHALKHPSSTTSNTLPSIPWSGYTDAEPLLLDDILRCVSYTTQTWYRSRF